MTCGACIRWRRLQRPRKAPRNWRTLFGRCRWPGIGASPAWSELRFPDGEGSEVAPECSPLLPETFGAGCAAFKAIRR